MGGGPPDFPQGSTCPVVLRILPLPSAFGYGAFTLSGRLSQNRSPGFQVTYAVHYPGALALRFRLFPFRSPLLRKSNFSFSSSGYLDVSVPRVPLHTLWIGVWMAGGFPAGFPHSEIRGLTGICPSPRLIAACHVFLRLSVPRHPPCALISLTFHQLKLAGFFPHFMA